MYVSVSNLGGAHIAYSGSFQLGRLLRFSSVASFFAEKEVGSCDYRDLALGANCDGEIHGFTAASDIVAGVRAEMIHVSYDWFLPGPRRSFEES